MAEYAGGCGSMTQEQLEMVRRYGEALAICPDMCDAIAAVLARLDELQRGDRKSRETGCWCDEYGHPCQGCEWRQRLEACEVALKPFAAFGRYIQEHPRSGLDENLYSWDNREDARVRKGDLIRAAEVLR